MTPPEKKPENAAEAHASTETASSENPHLPGLRTWRGVYLFVLGSFVVYVVLLAVLSRAFS